jgi:uncharacterized protein involved in exopolysaccharide biosynthesis
VDTNQLEPEEPATEMPSDPASSLLVPLLRSRWIVVSGLLLGAIAGIGYGVVQPNSYLSTGKLLVRYTAREEVSPEAMLAAPGQQGLGQPRDLVNNELELLSVPQVFEKVVREVTTQRIASSYDPTAEDAKGSAKPLRLFHRFQAWWFRRSSTQQVEKLGHVLDDCPACVSELAHDMMPPKGDFKLTGDPGSSVITVSYATHDPALARDVVTAFLAAAEERHRQTYSTSTTLEFVSGRLQESLAQLELAKTEFSEYRASCEVYDYDNQRLQLMTRSQDLEKEAAADASKLAQLKSTSLVLSDLLAKEPPTIVQMIPRGLVPNPQWSVLSQRLLSLKDQLDEIDLRVGGTTADREAAKEMIAHRIERTTADLKIEHEFIEQDPAPQAVPNPQFQRLTQEYADNKQEIAAQQTRTDKVVEELQSVRRHLATTEKCEPKYRSLEATAKNAQENYDAYKKAHEKTNMMSLLDQLEFSNLHRIQEATLPFDKEGPKRGKFLIVGILLGGLLGAALAFLMHALDPFIRSPAEVERLLGLRVVGVLPRSRLPRRLKRSIRHAAL